MDFGGANATYLLDMRRLHLLAMRKNQSTTSKSEFPNSFLENGRDVTYG